MTTWGPERGNYCSRGWGGPVGGIANRIVVKTQTNGVPFKRLSFYLVFMECVLF